MCACVCVCCIASRDSVSAENLTSVSCDCYSIPAILPASCTSVCSLTFEELVATDELLAAVITPGCSLHVSVKDRFIEHFPQSTQLELLLKQVCWRFHQQLLYLLPQTRTPRWTNAKMSVKILSAVETNPQQIEVMELEHKRRGDFAECIYRNVHSQCTNPNATVLSNECANNRNTNLATVV